MFLGGCILPSQFGGEKWDLPSKPDIKQISIAPVDDGYFMNREQAANLVDNVDELKAYVEKLEALVEKMKDYYNAK